VQPVFQVQQPLLELGQPRLVLVPRKREAQVHAVEDRLFGRGPRGGLGHRLALRRWGRGAAIQLPLDRPQHGLQHAHPHVTLVGRLDQGPGGVGGVRACEHLLGRLQPGVVLLVLLPFLLAHPPRHGRVALQLLESLLLLLPADVEPELDQDRAAVGQLPLEVADVVHRRAPLPGVGVLHALVQHAPVPGMVEDDHLAGARQNVPEAPHPRVVAIGLRGLADHLDLEAAGIEGLDQAVDHFALARRVPALEEDHHRHAGGPRRTLRRPQTRLQLGVDLLVSLLGNLLFQIQQLEHVPLSAGYKTPCPALTAVTIRHPVAWHPRRTPFAESWYGHGPPDSIRQAGRDCRRRSLW